MSASGLVVWMTGLSGSGKSTLAHKLCDKLKKEDIRAVILDGDILRAGLNKDLGFSDDDRKENIRRTAEVAKLLSHNGIVVIAALITPFQSLRDLAKDVIGDEYFEVFIHASLETCEKRDVKGLYKKARTGALSSFTGISSGFEPPLNPDLIIHTEQLNESESLESLYAAVAGRIYL